MHTESEAEKLWCPFARVQVGYGGDGGGAFAAVNRTWDWIRKHLGWKPGDDESEVCDCIASSCAAWRWVDSYTELSSAPLKPSEDWQSRRNEIGQLRGWERVRPNRRGYCGLAGKPD